MYSCHSILECCVMLSGVKLSTRLFVLFHRCVFQNNKATYDAKPDSLKEPSDRELYSSGGAVFCTKSVLVISDTKMITNFASYSGRSLFDKGCIIHLVNITIRIDEKMPRFTFSGLAIHSRGSLFVADVRIDMKKPILKNVKVSYIWVVGSQYSARSYIVPFADPQRVTLTCSAGNNMALDMIKYYLYIGNKSFANDPPVCRVQFRCVLCPQNPFGLAYGPAILLNSSSSKIGNIKCNPCPYGGDCSGEIKAKANFWGYKSGNQDTVTIKFLPCPRDYCCQGENSLTFNSCNENREGTLCGECQKGYGQGLSTAKCRKVSKCGNPVIWPIVIFGGIGYLGFLMYLSEISSILKKVFSWRKLNKQTEIGWQQCSVSNCLS